MTAAAYRKSIAMIAFTVIGALLAYLTDGVITAQEWIGVAITGTTSAGVLAAPNVPGAAYTKGILAGIGTILMFLATAITGGITGPEWVQILSIGTGTLFVILVPNEPLPGGLHPSQPLPELPAGGAPPTL